jgi:hypothetical protein
MKITGKLSEASLNLINQALCDHDCNITVTVGSSHMVGTETVKIHSDGFGEWYLFGGHCMWWGLIQAKSWEEAYGIYLEEFVTPDDMPENECELETGTWGDNGEWYNEATTSYIVSLYWGDYDKWDIDITPNN